MGHLVVGWLWLQQGLAAQKGLETADTQDERTFMTASCGRYAISCAMICPSRVKMDLVASLDDTCLRALGQLCQRINVMSGLGHLFCLLFGPYRVSGIVRNSD